MAMDSKFPRPWLLKSDLISILQLWKEGIITKKITRAEYKEILDKLGPSACRVCGKESEKKTDIGYRKTCKKCTEKAAKERKAKKAAAMKNGGKENA
jgi:tRNA(Ile2) C34 agmatinyltransferase TiaS